MGDIQMISGKDCLIDILSRECKANNHIAVTENGWALDFRSYVDVVVAIEEEFT
jgi:hypothetical protein